MNSPVTEHWIIDASPLILLGKSDQLGWLPRMGCLFVPESVAAEIRAGSPDDPARLWLESPAGMTSIISDPGVPDELLAWDLGRGETAVISLAMAHPGHEALLDDAAARRCAAVFSLPLRGTLSFVALAKKRGLVPACRPIFQKMQSAGLFVSQALVDQVALSVGE
jgi:predicted nucleic acid-binding protein